MAESRPQTVSRPELLESGTDRGFRKFLHEFMVFARLLESIRDHLAEHIGVTAPQYEMLSHLREADIDQGLTIGAIAERLHCTGPFVTTEVGKLRRQGLLDKRRDPRDARRVQVRLTRACELRFRQIAPMQRQLNDALFATVTAQQFQMLRKLFPALTHDGDRAAAIAATFGAGRERGAL